MSSDQLELRYIPLSQARRWDENPKLHDLPALFQSIDRYGFGDPPKYDATLNGLVYGNGRTEALEQMQAEGREPPRGIGVTGDGEWAVPVIFGVDAESRAAAVAFAIDHNNLGLLGGGALGFTDLLAMWDEEGLKQTLRTEPKAGPMLTSLNTEELAALIDGPDFSPVPESDQGRLDRKKEVTCPECGHEFEP